VLAGSLGEGDGRERGGPGEAARFRGESPGLDDGTAPAEGGGRERRERRSRRGMGVGVGK
jgi:hypothetical protein